MLWTAEFYFYVSSQEPTRKRTLWWTTKPPVCYFDSLWKGRVALAVWECLALHPSRRAATNEELGTPGALGSPGKPADSWGAPWTAEDAPRPASRTGARRCRNVYTAWQFHPRDFNYETCSAKGAATFQTPVLNWRIVSYYLCPSVLADTKPCHGVHDSGRARAGWPCLPGAPARRPQPGAAFAAGGGGRSGRGRVRCRRGPLPGQALPSSAGTRTERGLSRGTRRCSPVLLPARAN